MQRILDLLSGAWGLGPPSVHSDNQIHPLESLIFPYLVLNGYSQVLVGQISLVFPVVPSSWSHSSQKTTDRTLSAFKQLYKTLLVHWFNGPSSNWPVDPLANWPIDPLVCYNYLFICLGG